jgi:hypothetical protein
MNKEIQEAIQYIDSVVWFLEQEHRRHLLSLTTFAQEWSWLEGALSEALGEQILLEAMALKENYEIVDENVLKQVKALRAKV